MAESGTIVAMGGGGFSMDADTLLDDYVLSFARRTPPRVCYVPTAGGDADSYVVRFYRAFPVERCLPSHLPLFQRDERDLRAYLLDQDVIYVGGGNTVNMLAIWRKHGLDALLREAWEAGVVLCGLSAGSLCWFEAGVTDSYGGLARLDDGLGFLPGSHCPHYDGEPGRRPAYRRYVGEGLRAGVAADDGVGLRYEGTELVEIVTSRRGARAFRVERTGGEVVETPLEARFLGG